MKWGINMLSIKKYIKYKKRRRIINNERSVLRGFTKKGKWMDRLVKK